MCFESKLSHYIVLDSNLEHCHQVEGRRIKKDAIKNDRKWHKSLFLTRGEAMCEGANYKYNKIPSEYDVNIVPTSIWPLFFFIKKRERKGMGSCILVWYTAMKFIYRLSFWNSRKGLSTHTTIKITNTVSELYIFHSFFFVLIAFDCMRHKHSIAEWWLLFFFGILRINRFVDGHEL